MLAVHFGAGNIGRGFIGQLLSQAGYTVCFVDVNKEIVKEINERQSYTVMLASEEKTTYAISGVEAVDGSDVEAVAAKIAHADLVTTAVGPNVLKFIAPAIAQGIKRRMDGVAAGLTVIACENMIGGSSILKDHVYSHLTDDDKAAAELQISFPDAAVDRIVPIQKHEDKLLVMVEPFFEWVVNQSQIKGEVPTVEGITYVDDLKPFIERKLYTVNTGHAAVAYLSYLHGVPSIDAGMKDPEIAAAARKALEETGALLVAKYKFDQAAHQAYIDKILSRYKNPHITDEVTRVGRSPIRKVSAGDRLTGPAVQAAAYGIVPSGLAAVIAAAFLFDYAEDGEAVEIQEAIQRDGLAAAVARYTGLEIGSHVHGMIMEEYARLAQHKS